MAFQFQLFAFIFLSFICLCITGTGTGYSSTERQSSVVSFMACENRKSNHTSKRVRFASFIFMILYSSSVTIVVHKCCLFNRLLQTHKVCQRKYSMALQIRSHQARVDCLRLTKTSRLTTDFTKMPTDHWVFPERPVTMMMHSIHSGDDYDEDDLETDGATESHMNHHGHSPSSTKRTMTNMVTATQGTKPNDTQTMPTAENINQYDNDRFASASPFRDSSAQTSSHHLDNRLSSNDHPSLMGLEWVKAYCGRAKSASEDHEESLRAWNEAILEGKCIRHFT